MPRRLSSLIIVLLAGNGVLSALRFMVLPFIAIFMRVHLGAPPTTVGFVVGLGALAGLVSAPVLGPLSDRHGRKPIFLLGMTVISLAILGFAFGDSLVAFAILSLVLGAAFGLEGSAYQALLTDLAPPAMRVRVFGYQYWTTNVGAAAGPLVGALAGAGHSSVAFVISGGASLALVVVLFVLLPGDVGRRPEAGVSAAQSFGHLLDGLRVPVILGYLIGIFFSSIAYSQINTNLAEFLGSSFASGARLYAVVIAANAATVLVLQPFLARWQERRPLLWGLLIGTGFYIVASIVFGFDHSWVSWIATMVVFTVGEVLLSPSQQAVIATVAPEDRRATYFTLVGVAWSLSSFAGPVLGGAALGLGPGYLFGLMAVANAAALVTYLVSLTGDVRLTRTLGSEVSRAASS